MINTIFYFTDSLPYETYQAKMDKDGDDGIASKTIVFAKQQGKIYNNGYSYGITQSEIQQLINASVATSQGKLENDDAVIREALTSLSSDLNGAKGRISTAEQAITTLQNTLSTTQDNLSNYVTLDTDQELTGDKLFRGINQFTFNKLSKDGVLVQSGINTVNVKQSRITSEQITTPKIVVTGQPSDNVLLAGGSSLNLSDQGYASGSAVQDGFDDVNGRLGDLSDAVDDKLSLSTGGTVTGDITADSFIKTGSSNNYVLLGGGGHKLLSEITPASPGTTIVHEDYDDTELRTAISNLNTAINDANTTATTEYGKLNTLINNLDSSIQTKIENLFDDSTWIQQNFPAGTTGGGSNFGQSDVESYLQTLGVWTTDGQGNTVTQWSKLNQDVTSISGRVTQLEGNAATGGNVNYSLLSSSLYSYILDNYTTAGMESTWAKFAQLTNGDMQMLKWMSSGASSYANDATSTANLFAAAKNYSDNGSTISQAVSNINALVERDQNDNLVAKSAMESMVDSAITGIINTATSSQAGTTIFSKVNQNSDDIATITTKITGDTSSASVATKLGDMTAGLVTTATLDSAAASLISGSANTSLKSAVMTKVSDGITSAQLVAASDYNAASIVAMVNASNDSSIKLSADKINIDANHQLDLSAQTITVDAENVNNLASKIDARAADVTVKSLSATNGTSSVIANSNGIIIKPTSSTTSVELKEDGSGNIASGAISWNTNGRLSVEGTVKAKLMYSPNRWVYNQNYTIDPNTDPYCSFYTLGNEYNITLPSANIFDGIELQFTPIRPQFFTSYGIKLITSGTDKIWIVKDNQQGVSESSYGYCADYRVTKIKAVNGSWLLIDGEITISYTPPISTVG